MAWKTPAWPFWYDPNRIITAAHWQQIRTPGRINSQEVSWLITLRPATIHDALRLYVWRIHPTTRAMFRNTAPISWESHVEWLTLTLLNLSRVLYIVERDGDPVGTARLDMDGVEAEVSITIAPEARGAGIGTEALQLLHDVAFASHVLQRLVARIKVENGASIKAFERAGFVEQSRTETEVVLVAER